MNTQTYGFWFRSQGRVSAVSAALLLLSTAVAWGQVRYVRADGSDAATGADWENAWATISNAVNNASPLDTILVSNGTYGVRSEISVNKSVSIIGQGVREETIVERIGVQSNRIFNLSNADALVANLTIRNGYIAIPGGNGGGGALSGGGGIIMTGGIVSNCVITLNTNDLGTSGYPYGGGVSMSGGTLWGCTVSSNTPLGYSSYGHGVYMRGGTIRDSLVIRNRGRSSNDQGSGAGIFMITGGMVTNTDIIANGGEFNSASRVGGVYCSAGMVVDCTIVSNVCVGVQLLGAAVLSGSTVAYTRSSPWGGCNVSLVGSGGLTNCTIFGGVSVPGVDFVSSSTLVVDCVVSNEASGAFRFNAGKINNLVRNGTVYNSIVSLGNAAAANSNQFLVTGSGKLWDLNGKNVTVGFATSTNNALTISDAGTVDNIGTLSVLGTSNTVNLLGGTLGVKTITTYPTAFVAGDGVQNATLKVLSGILTFPSGLTITNNATLAGNGKLVAATRVFGTVSPGASVGALTNSGILTLTSDATTQIELAANTKPGVGWDLVAVDTGALELGGSLDVQVINGFTPIKTQSFVVMTNLTAASVSGTFSNLSGDRVPAIIGGKAAGSFRVVVGTRSVVLDAFALNPASTLIILR